MQDLFPEVKSWLEQNRPFALATVIRTWGSAPRPTGAHMAVSQEGEMIGSVSGGCVESAVVDAAQQVLAENQCQRLAFGVSNETAWEVGLACGGTIEIFLQRLVPQDRWVIALASLLENKQSGVLATLIKGRQEWLGRQLLLMERGTEGSLQGGELDRHLQQVLDARRPPRQPQIMSLENQEIFIEPILPPPRLIVIGGVHIAIPLTRFALELGYEVILVDPRTRFANPERFPHVEKILNQWPDEAIQSLGLDANTFVVALTHDPKLDDPALIAALNGHPAYIGVLGSRRTHEKRIARLKDAGIAPEQLEQLHAPIGLSIGAKSPAEIALSIVAEMTAVARGQDG
ncbi:MAG: XdhC family protein [Calditrichaeota bacterium]|nr:MAG: XdhC family protein [Calditrichota bacterium]